MKNKKKIEIEIDEKLESHKIGQHLGIQSIYSMKPLKTFKKTLPPLFA